MNEPDCPRTINLFKNEPIPTSLAMPVKILHPTHTELVGTGYILLVALQVPTTASPDSGQVVEDAALTARAYAIIGKPQHGNAEDPAQDELRQRISSIIEENGIRCILDIGARPESGLDVQTDNAETGELVRTFLAKNFKVTTGEPGTTVKPMSPSLEGKKPDGTLTVQSVRINIGGEELEMRRDKLVDQLAELVGILNVRLGFDPSQNVVAED